MAALRWNPSVEIIGIRELEEKGARILEFIQILRFFQGVKVSHD